VLEKTINIIRELEKSEYSTDAANAKLFFPIKELRAEKSDIDKNYLCEMYPPLTDGQIDEYSSAYMHYFPEELKQLYKYTNGIRVFDKRISIGGLEPQQRLRPTHGGREYTPIHRIDSSGNSQRHKKYWGDGRLFFAEYTMEEAPNKFVYVDGMDPSPIKPVYACFGGSEEVLESWDSIDDWFSSEYEKYMQKFKKKEYKIISIGDGILKNMYFTD
jgi:hypothetical protein